VDDTCAAALTQVESFIVERDSLANGVGRSGGRFCRLIDVHVKGDIERSVGEVRAV
jgi:hypothetical protein